MEFGMRLSTKYTKDTKQAAKGPSCFSCISWIGLLLVLTLAACSSKPTDVRTVVPGDALIYLETQDLGKALQAVTDNDAFRAAAKSQPDVSALNGIKVGVAVTGFETKDIPTPDGPTELNVQPRFVAVAETNAWNYQAIKVAENKLGEFVNDIYGGGGSDVILGEDGEDLIYGQNGNDTVDGGNDDDEIYGGRSDDDLAGSAGSDYLDGNSGDDVLDGGTEGDHLIDLDGADTLYGAAGNDHLDALDFDNDDLLDAGPGKDKIEKDPGDLT